MQIIFVKRSNAPILIVWGVVLLIGTCLYYFYQGQIGIGLPAIIITVSILIFLSLVWSTLSPPILTISDEGIQDFRLGVGVISWKDIESAQLEVQYGNRYICLQVSEPEKYVGRLSPAMRKKRLDLHDIGFKGFNIDLRGARVNLVELLHIIQTKSSN